MVLSFEATVAQQAEQLICNQRVGGSIPFGGSTIFIDLCNCECLCTSKGEVPEWPKGADCKSAGAAFGGSNPPLSIRKRCGSSSVVERQPSKLRVAGSNPVSRSIFWI